MRALFLTRRLWTRPPSPFDLYPGNKIQAIQITMPIDAFHEIHGSLTAKDGRVINQGQLTLTDTTDQPFTLR